MAKHKSNPQKSHDFRNKLLLNQWLISQMGVDPLAEKYKTGAKRPFHILSELIRSQKLEGLDKDNLHHFYHAMVESELFFDDTHSISKAQLLTYEENIVRHTRVINEKRSRHVVWKYFQWLSLIFTEIYLDRFFSDKMTLLAELNNYVMRFSQNWPDFHDLTPYTEDDLNKVCLQNATGSGKTLLMHVNLLQYRHYAMKHGKDKDLSRIILITPNDSLSEQHISEFKESSISASNFSKEGHHLFTMASGLKRVDVLEITKLADQEGPNTITARSLGDQNLLLVDEGHRGLSGKDAKKNENAWFRNRAMLSEKGFTFEYSATFDQAVAGTGHEDDYAKAILFDYSYRWFYEDGFGKDYKIDNLPHPDKETIRRLIENGNIPKAANLAHDRAVADQIMPFFLTACLLKFYQQLLIYKEKTSAFSAFNLEKPLWVFVGSTVAKARGGTQDEEMVSSDVAKIILFIADFLADKNSACRRIETILTSRGQDTGLLDKDGNDIFTGAFTYLSNSVNNGEAIDSVYHNILTMLFNSSAGGKLILERIKGDSGEILLKSGNADVPFGLINVGDARGLCEHLQEIAEQKFTVTESDFNEPIFDSVKDSSSTVNLLIGSKKFVEGWDCWRVSTMGLMHVGKSEGAQIIQLFGRGVRLKGYEWCLKRSGHSQATEFPNFIEELETLNVFGIEADFMEKFREFLKKEGLPGNERKTTITIPLNVTYDFGKKLKIIRPKRKKSDGMEYDFKKDGPVPEIAAVPPYMKQNTVVSDWYPRIQAMKSKGTVQAGNKDKVCFKEAQLSLLDYDLLYFDLEQYKRERGWYNLNISKNGIKQLLSDNGWYTLLLPESHMNPSSFADIRTLQQIAAELLKRYCDQYYNYCKRKYIEPRLELRELTADDENLPKEELYYLIVDGDETQLIQGIQKIKTDLETKKEELLRAGDLNACNFGKHLFQPLFHIRSGGKITILPVSLKESEYQFVTDLKSWCDSNKATLEKDGMELFLLRNLSRGKGVGFFEAGNFHPDFILWMLYKGKQYVTFIEPHGLLHEGPASEKILFHERIKDVEKRLNDPDVVLNSFILSFTKYPQLKWDNTQEELENKHVLFMTSEPDRYIDKLFDRLRGMVK